jgi:hypothetical protein
MIPKTHNRETLAGIREGDLLFKTEKWAFPA